MWDWWDDTVDAVSSVVDDVSATISDTYHYAADTAGKWVSDAVDTVSDWISGTGSQASDKVAEVEDDFALSYDEFYSGASAPITAMEDAVNLSWDDIYGPAANTQAKATAMAQDHIDGYDNTASGSAASAAAAAEGAFYPGAGWTGDMLDKISFELGFGFDAAMATLCALPDLIMKLKNDLAGWFDLDVDQLIASWKAAQEKMKPAEET